MLQALPKTRTQNIRVWKGLFVLIERAPTKKIRDLAFPQIHLNKVQSSSFFQVTERGNGTFYKTQATIRIPLMISMSICKTK